MRSCRATRPPRPHTGHWHLLLCRLDTVAWVRPWTHATVGARRRCSARLVLRWSGWSVRPSPLCVNVAAPSRLLSISTGGCPTKCVTDSVAVLLARDILLCAQHLVRLVGEEHVAGDARLRSTGSSHDARRAAPAGVLPELDVDALQRRTERPRSTGRPSFAASEFAFEFFVTITPSGSPSVS